MKKLLLTSIIIGFIQYNGDAQITVTSSNVAGIGKTIVQANDTIPSVNVPSSGASQTWDYSTGLVEHTDDTLSFINPLWTVSSSFFPSSNLAADDGNGNTIYMSNTSSGLSMLGFAGDFFGAGSETQIFLSPVDELLRFPATYNDAYTTQSVQNLMILGSDVGAPVDSIIIKNYNTKVVSINGYGSVTTPLGTFSAILVHEINYGADSTWTYTLGFESLVSDAIDTSYTSSFWTDDAAAGFPLMDITHDNAGNVSNVTWLKVTPFLGVDEKNQVFSIYPNPTSNNIRIEGNLLGKTIEIIDLTGKIVISEKSINSVYIANVSDLDNGFYLVTIKDEIGNLISTKKIEVLK